MHAEALIAKEEKVKAEAESCNAKVEMQQKQDDWLKKWASEGEFAELCVVGQCLHSLLFAVLSLLRILLMMFCFWS